MEGVASRTFNRSSIQRIGCQLTKVNCQLSIVYWGLAAKYAGPLDIRHLGTDVGLSGAVFDAKFPFLDRRVRSGRFRLVLAKAEN